MNQDALVSIILPAYNSEKTIENCIESILKQTISNWILYIVNDGSTDNTSDILDEYSLQDSRINVFHRKNHGVSSSRNFMISKVKTPYFVCIDSDDCIFPNYLEELLIAKKKYPDYIHIWSGFQTVSSQKTIDGEKHILSTNSIYSSYDRNDILFLYDSWMVQMPWHKLYETKIVQENNLKMDESLSLGEDLLFNLHYLDLVKNTKILFINKVTYNYVRSDKDSLDHKYRSDLLYIYEKIDDVFSKCLEVWNINNREIFYNSCYYHYENILKNTFHSDNKSSFFKKIKYNNKILKSSNFKEVYDKKNCHVNKFYDMAYRSQNYLLVRCLDLLIKIKKGK